MKTVQVAPVIHKRSQQRCLLQTMEPCKQRVTGNWFKTWHTVLCRLRMARLYGNMAGLRI
jgi:hypothetical protein